MISPKTGEADSQVTGGNTESQATIKKPAIYVIYMIILDLYVGLHSRAVHNTVIFF